MKKNIAIFKFKKNFLITCATKSVFFSLQAIAQDLPNTPEQVIDEAIRRQEEKAKEYSEKIQKKEDVLIPEKELDLSREIPIEDNCFTINKIQFLGEYLEYFPWLDDEVKFILNKCVGLNGLQKVLNILNSELIQEGYVTSRVSISEQNISLGKIQFLVHVGKISEIKMIKKNSLEKIEDENWGTWKNAFPIKVGDVLNIRNLEQGIEQMRKLPSQKITTQIEPGNKINTSIIYILREEIPILSRIRLGVTLDNSSTKAMGKSQIASFLAFDNLLGINDIFSLSAISNAENIYEENHSQSFTGNYLFPFKFSNFSISNTYSRYAQTITLTTAKILAKGYSNKTDFKWDYNVLRGASYKLGVFFNVSYKVAKSYIGDVEIIKQSRRITNSEVGFTYKKIIGRASIDYSLSYREGTGWFNAQPDEMQYNNDGMTIRPKIWLSSLSYQQLISPWNYPIQLSSIARFQYTQNKTGTADQFAIGNRYSVRGFDGENSLIAESGYSIKNDIYFPLKFLPEFMSSIAYIGADFGQVWGKSGIYLPGKILSGTVAGIQGKITKFHYDIAVAAPIYKPQKFKSSIWNLYLTLSSNF
ncbi:ShlB/FhaC/HecB family hemolysin secretion/activation protein [Pigmentibacter ruber]